jgi:hypothetical protein
MMQGRSRGLCRLGYRHSFARMIISTGRNYIFVHIPKTGGTSMALALEQRAMKDDILIGDTPKAKRRRNRLKGAESAGRLWKHSTLADIDGLVSADQIDKTFVFTLVRNPWDRMVSYYHWLQDQIFDHPAVRLAKSVDFSKFLNAPETRMAMKAMPYRHYVTDVRGRARCNAFIRLESIETDCAPLWDHLGFRLDLPQKNQSRRIEDYREYYSDHDAALVKSLCAQDIARFGYSY